MSKHIEVVNHHGNQYSIDVRENDKLVESDNLGAIGAKAAMDIAQTVARELGITEIQDWT